MRKTPYQTLSSAPRKLGPDPELPLLVASAKKAAGKESRLKDEDFLLLASMVQDRHVLVGHTLIDEHGRNPKAKADHIDDQTSRALAWIFYRDTAAAARALSAAHAMWHRYAEAKGGSKMSFDHDALLSIKELAAALRKSRRFVMYMRARGFRMPGGSATVSEAREWLSKNPTPCSKRKFTIKI